MKKSLGINNYFDVYQVYEQAKMSTNFISYDKFMSSLLFNNNLGFESDIYKRFFNEFSSAFLEKKDVIFSKFIITFNVNLKFSSNALVPMIVYNETSNNESIVFSKSNDEQYNNFLTSLNKEIEQNLLQWKCLEIFPNVILFISPQTNTLIIVFDKSICAYIPEEKTKKDK